MLQLTNKHAYEREPGTMMVAEESTSWPGVTRPVNWGGLGFGFKWNMGWMNDSLRYLGREPIYRQYHHHEMTFAMAYAYSENFILPISHDEVVHGKGSMFERAPQDEWRKFGNLRAFYAFMWAHPGKKLLFMGTEFGQRREFSEDRSIDWWQSAEWGHRGVQRLVKDLNAVYRENPALWKLDTDPAGFSWIDADDAGGNVFSWLRYDGEGQMIACITNFSSEPRPDHRIGLPAEGVWKEILNTDAEVYDGTGHIGNLGQVVATNVPSHGYVASAAVTIPPLGAVWLRFEPVSTEEQPEPDKVEAGVRAAARAASPHRTTVDDDREEEVDVPPEDPRSSRPAPNRSAGPSRPRPPAGSPDGAADDRAAGRALRSGPARSDEPGGGGQRDPAGRAAVTRKRRRRRSRPTPRSRRPRPRRRSPTNRLTGSHRPPPARGGRGGHSGLGAGCRSRRARSGPWPSRPTMRWSARACAGCRRSVPARDRSARRAVLRAGFRQEGVQREAVARPDGGRDDLYLFARLAADQVGGPHGFSGGDELHAAPQAADRPRAAARRRGPGAALRDAVQARLGAARRHRRAGRVTPAGGDPGGAGGAGRDLAGRPAAGRGLDAALPRLGGRHRDDLRRRPGDRGRSWPSSCCSRARSGGCGCAPWTRRPSSSLRSPIAGSAWPPGSAPTRWPTSRTAPRRRRFPEPVVLALSGCRYRSNSSRTVGRAISSRLSGQASVALPLRRDDLADRRHRQGLLLVPGLQGALAGGLLDR